MCERKTLRGNGVNKKLGLGLEAERSLGRISFCKSGIAKELFTDSLLRLAGVWSGVGCQLLHQNSPRGGG